MECRRHCPPIDPAPDAICTPPKRNGNGENGSAFLSLSVLPNILHLAVEIDRPAALAI